MDNIQITSQGVKRSLNKFTEIESIIEYIWNGFDAKATNIVVDINFNALGRISEIRIKDNGVGIDRNCLSEKFKPFFQSEKIEKQIQEKKKQNSTYHGKNGVGRLTFFQFCNSAVWETVFKDSDGKNKKYTISINEDDLTIYKTTEANQTDEPCGTTVIFNSIFAFISIPELEEEIKTEFCWYLMLNKEKNYSITLNGKSIDISSLVTEKDNGLLLIGENSFQWEFISWNISLKKEYSRYYFLNSKNSEAFKTYTTFNKKGDKFYHSIYVKSQFFDEFIFSKQDIDSSQMSFFQRQNDTYKTLIIKLDRIISDKRTPYIRKYSRKIIDDLEEIKAFALYNDNDLVDVYKKNNLQSFIQELYIIEPKIFAQLNKEQKLTFVRLLDAAMNSTDRDNLFNILNSVLDLNSQEKEDLSKALESTPLNNIANVINFILARLTALDYFERMVYDKSLNANEVNDLQFMLEQNYWLFGEQYTAVAKAEDNFVALVKNHLDVLRKEDGEENESVLDKIKAHPDKLKQVDLCCVRQMPSSSAIENIVVEIKHPLKTLTQAHYQQLRRYMDIITSVSEFNADNFKWTFYLVGTSISKSLQDDLDNSKGKGKPGLIFEKDNYRIEIFVKTWKSIFNDYRIKYNTLHDKLKVEELAVVKNSKKEDIKEAQAKLKVV